MQAHTIQQMENLPSFVHKHPSLTKPHRATPITLPTSAHSLAAGTDSEASSASSKPTELATLVAASTTSRSRSRPCEVARGRVDRLSPWRKPKTEWIPSVAQDGIWSNVATPMSPSERRANEPPRRQAVGEKMSAMLMAGMERGMGRMCLSDPVVPTVRNAEETGRSDRNVLGLPLDLEG